MFNFHEKIKKQIGTGFVEPIGSLLTCPTEEAHPFHDICFILLLSTYPDNNLHTIITVSSYI